MDDRNQRENKMDLPKSELKEVLVVSEDKRTAMFSGVVDFEEASAIYTRRFQDSPLELDKGSLRKMPGYFCEDRGFVICDASNPKGSQYTAVTLKEKSDEPES